MGMDLSGEMVIIALAIVLGVYGARGIAHGTKAAWHHTAGHVLKHHPKKGKA